jgi:nucleoside phosphorylase
MLDILKQFGSPAWVVKPTDFAKFLQLTYQPNCFGEIWLFNNDLQILSDYDHFRPLYLERIAKTLSERIDAVKILVNEECESRIFNSELELIDKSIKEHLLAIAGLAKGPQMLNSFYFGKMSNANIPDFLTNSINPYTIVFYNHRHIIDRNPGVVIVRHNVFPFASTSGNDSARFAVVWQLKDQEDDIIQVRLKSAFEEAFNSAENFYHVEYVPSTNSLKLIKGWSTISTERKVTRINKSCEGLNLGDSVDVLVVASQYSELSPLMDKFKRKLPASDRVHLTPISNDRSKYTILESDTRPEPKKILFTVIGEGNIMAACKTWDALQKWNPKVVILLGVAGGDPREKGKGTQKLGDVVIGERIVGYEVGKLERGVLSQRPSIHNVTGDLLVIAEEAFEICKEKHYWDELEELYPILDPTKDEFQKPELHRFAIASGSKIVADASFFETKPFVDEKVHAIEMEGDGVGHACKHHKSKPDFLVIKSIMDFASEETRGPDRDRWKTYSSHVAATLVYQILHEL